MGSPTIKTANEQKSLHLMVNVSPPPHLLRGNTTTTKNQTTVIKTIVTIVSSTYPADIYKFNHTIHRTEVEVEMTMKLKPQGQYMFLQIIFKSLTNLKQ